MSRKFVEISLILLIVLLVAVAVVLALRGGDEQAPVGGTAGELLQYVPGDTPLLLLSAGSEEMTRHTEAMFKRANPQDIEAIIPVLEEFEAHLWAWLLQDYVDTLVNGGLTGLTERYGVDPQGRVLLYLHGAAPVFRWTLSDPQALGALLAEAQAGSGVTLRQEALGDGQLYAWPLPGESGMEVALLITDQALTLSLLHPSDTDQARRQRYALEPTRDSLAQAKPFRDLMNTYALADQFAGYMDLHRITEMLLLPEQSSSGRELQGWFPELYTEFGATLSSDCRRDYVGLISQFPRISMGMTELTVDDSQLHQGLSGTWHIENAAALQSLSKLQGYLPSYSRRADDKLFAYALGLNMNQLIPVATELWQQFLAAEYRCEHLTLAQQTLRPMNPAMLAMMGVSMVDAVRGVGLALFDLNENAATLVDLPGSLLLSVSSTEPAATATVAGMFIPQLAGLHLAADGSPTTLPDFFGLQGVQAAIQGDHLVFYRGEKARRAAQQLATETLEERGLAAMALNLSDTPALTETLRRTLADTMPLPGCGTLYGGLLSLSPMAMQVTTSSRYSAQGWSGDGRFTVVLPEALDIEALAGRYEVAILGEHDCQWLTLGWEELSDDGSGRYAGQLPGQACETFRGEFRWSLAGSLIRREILALEERSDCDQPWRDAEPLGTDCAVFAESGQGFFCVLQTAEEAMTFRYLAQ